MLISALSGQVPGVVVNAALRTVVLQNMIANAPILQYLQFYSHPGSADSWLKKAIATGGANRAIDADYVDNLTTPEFGTSALKIFGDKIQTDMAWERRGVNVPDEHLRQIIEFAKSLGRELQNQFVNGTIGATTFSGIIELMPAAQDVTFDSTGTGVVELGNTSAIFKQNRIFFEALDDLIGSINGGADFLLMNVKMRNRIRSLGKDFLTVSTIQDALGANQQVESYNGVPIILSGYAKDGTTSVITNTEVVGARAGCTSIYAIKTSEKADLTAGTNVGLQVISDGKVGVHLTSRVEMDVDLSLMQDKAIARLKGIVAS